MLLNIVEMQLLSWPGHAASREEKIYMKRTFSFHNQGKKMVQRANVCS